jgi:hypothetical protein
MVDPIIPYDPNVPFPLGEIEAVDERSRNFLLTDHVDIPRLDQLTRTYRYWPLRGGILNQSPQSRGGMSHRRDNRTVDDPYGAGHCVGFGCLTYARMGPVYNPLAELTGSDVYFVAQDHDAWNEPKDQYGQEPYNGSSLNGGLKALRQFGVVSGWYNLTTIDQLVAVVMNNGPIISATDWKWGMFHPTRANGYMYHASGGSAGGHLYCVHGVNIRTEKARIPQTWGTRHGIGGYAYISLADLELLMKERTFPAAAPFEVVRP